MKNLLDFLALALVYGTMVAAVAWGLESLLRTRISPAYSSALWTVALAKFFLPFGPALSFPVRPTLSPGALVFATPLALPGQAAALSPASPWPRWPTLICAAYLVAIAVLAARRLIAARRLSRSIDALPEASPPLLESVHAAASKLELRTIPVVRVGSGPFIAGLWRPVLVVPFERCETPQAHAVLLHELAHLRRGDQWVRALQNLARLIFFFWPPVHQVNRKIEHYRELACDQLALEHGPLSPAAYALVLLEARRDAARGHSGLALLQMSSSSSRLEERIELLLTLDRPRSARWAVLAVASGAALALTGTAFAVDAGGEKPKGPVDEAVVKKLVLDSQSLLDACYSAANAGTSANRPAWSSGYSVESAVSAPVEDQGPVAAPVERFEGKLVLHWTIAPSGAVTDVCMTSAELTPKPPAQREAELGRCLSEVVRAWTFPKPKSGGAVEVSYPFAFTGGC